MNEVISTLRPPRPFGLPESVSDQLLLDVVRDYLLGERDKYCALKFGIDTHLFYEITKTVQWRFLQNQFRDEFLATTGGRLIRIEQKILDKLVEYIDDGVEAVSMEGNVYIRQISPKEAVQIAAMVGDANKRLDKLREGDATRKTFDASEWKRRLERLAAATEVEGESERTA